RPAPNQIPIMRYSMKTTGLPKKKLNLPVASAACCNPKNSFNTNSVIKVIRKMEPMAKISMPSWVSHSFLPLGKRRQMSNQLIFLFFKKNVATKVPT
ncbi:MAG: hypothetical protein ACI86M_000519, partial [Saprospiraceae bacterium]